MGEILTVVGPEQSEIPRLGAFRLDLLFYRFGRGSGLVFTWPFVSLRKKRKHLKKRSEDYDLRTCTTRVRVPMCAI